MRRVMSFIAAGALLALPAGTQAQVQSQDRQAIERAVTAVTHEWARTWTARDAAGWAALHDTPAGLFVVGGSVWPFDSLRVKAEQMMAQRTNESWTIDKVHVIVLGASEALVQFTASGRFTLANGQTWVCDRSGYETALVRKRGDAWKIVAFHNSAGCRQA